MRISLLLLLLLSMISIVLIKFIWVNEPGFWKFGYETGEIVFGLSIGYIAAFIFYVIDVWIPKNEEVRKVNNRLSVPLSRLLNNMRIPLLMIYKTYYKDNISFDSIKKEINKVAVSKIDLINHGSPMIIWPQNRPANYGEYLIDHINDVNKYAEKINKLPVPLDIDLIEILDDIEASSYHEIMISAYKISSFKKNSIQMKGTAIEKEVYEYYSLYYKLKKYIKENKIKLAIVNL